MTPLCLPQRGVFPFLPQLQNSKQEEACKVKNANLPDLRNQMQLSRDENGKEIRMDTIGQPECVLYSYIT